MSYDYAGAIKGFVRRLDQNGTYKEKPYAFISYSHAIEDVEQIYPFLKELFERGYVLVLDTEYAEMNDSWVNGMTKRVYHENCKQMLTFSSESYMYSRPSLIEQYCRYSEVCRSYHNGDFLPCILVDTTNDMSFEYMKKPNQTMINRTQAKNPKERYTLRENSESAECLRRGLFGFYSNGGDNSMAYRIINCEYEALQKYENVDAIRRQMRFVLQGENSYNHICSIKANDAVEKVIEQLENSGISADIEIKEMARTHFREWGSEIYEYMHDGQMIARMKYNPKERMFQLIQENDDTPIGEKTQDILELTKCVLGTDAVNNNPEEYWISIEDKKSLRNKHGYFSDYELTEEQENIYKRVLANIRKHINICDTYENSMGHLIMIQGDAGTGKTVLAQRIFTDIKKEYPEGDYYFVVNHAELVSQYKNELKKYNVDENRVDAPSIVLNHVEARRNENQAIRPDIIFVDEAHLMLTQNTQQYTGKNKKFIKGDNMVADMRRNAKVVVLMFDRNQILQARQFWKEDDLNALVNESIETGSFALLKRQMRITASQDVVNWISSFVGDQHKLMPIPQESDYDFRIFTSVKEMYQLIREYAGEEENKYARVVATFDWAYSQAHGTGKEDKEPWMVSVPEENWELPWNDEHFARDVYYQKKYKKDESRPWIEQDYSIDEVGSTFSVQGFDLPYVGVILGPSISFDKDNNRIVVVPENCRDKKASNTRTYEDGTKANFTEILVWNAVNILLTRGRKGLFIYAVDENLREALMVASGVTNEVVLPSDCTIDTTNQNAWQMVHERAYEVDIQVADEKRNYNVEGKKGEGVVFNKLIQKELPVAGYQYVVTGVLGEMYPIYKSELIDFEIGEGQKIGAKPRKFVKKANHIDYYAIQIPVQYKFQIKLASGKVLEGNTDGIEHGEGDYLICTSFERRDYRIVKGNIFDKLYEI